MAPLEILIVGCGVAGPTLASFLLISPLPASQKPRITVLERSSEVSANGQNIDIRGAGVTIIKKLGLERAIRESTTGEVGVQWVDAQDRVWGALGADRSGRVQSPTSDIEILRGRLAELCWMRSKSISDEVFSRGEKEENGGGGSGGVEYVFGDYLDELDQRDGRRVHVRFAKSGLRRSFDLVVGADGLQSRTRRMVWGADSEEGRVKRLGLYAGFFSMPRAPTDSMWRRWFHAPGRRSIMLRPDAQKGRTTAFVAVLNEEDKRLVEVAKKGHLGVEEQKALLEEYFRDVGWEVDRVIREMKATKDFYYDLVGQVKMDKWSKGRVVLLGDAGYCASPISGMGTTLALNGAYNLAGALLRHPDDPTAAFPEYEDKMRPLVDRAQRLVPGAPHILFPETAWGVWIANALVWLISASGLASLLFRFGGPPANAVPVEEYGFRQLSEFNP